MPAHELASARCQQPRSSRGQGWIDLHVHTTASDGTYTPAQVVDVASRSGLAAVALTDHDTLAGVGPAQEAARSCQLEIIPAVEVTAEHDGREIHILGYFVDPGNAALHEALQRLRESRTSRFWEMVDRLGSCGLRVDRQELKAQVGASSLGRRQLAEYLVRTRRAGSVREVFSRYLADDGRAHVPKDRLPVATAVALVRGAGGVAAWAHPGALATHTSLAGLRAIGLAAVEVDHPSHRRSRVRELRTLAAELGLAATGGSDCHGPSHPRRAVGACGVTPAELHALRRHAAR